jgi:hypothetical protein
MGPIRDFALEFDAVLVSFGAQEIDGEVSDDGHGSCAMTFAQPRSSLAVLPVGAHPPRRCSRHYADDAQLDASFFWHAAA